MSQFDIEASWSEGRIDLINPLHRNFQIIKAQLS